MKKPSKILICAIPAMGAILALAYFAYARHAEISEKKWIENTQKLSNAGDYKAQFDLEIFNAEKKNKTPSIQLLCELSWHVPEARKKLAEIKSELESKAQKGDIQAASDLGWYYFLPRSPEHNEPKGIELLEQAAAKGYAEACRKLSKIYQGAYIFAWNPDDANRQSTPKDFKKHFEYTKKAAELDPQNAYGLKELGNCYLRGIGVEMDLQKAAQSYEKYLENEIEASGMDAVEKMRLAAMFASGDFGEANKETGSAFFERLHSALTSKNWNECDYMTDNVYAAAYAIFSEGNFVSKDQKKADAIFEKFKDKAAFAHAIRKIFMGRTIGVSDFINITNRKNADKWRNYLLKNKDAYAIFEKAFLESFGGMPDVDGGILEFHEIPQKLSEYTGSDLKGKAEKLIPLAEAMEEQCKQTGSGKYNSRRPEILSVYLAAENHGKIRAWIKNYFEKETPNRNMPYMAAGIYVLSKESPVFKNNYQEARKYFETVLYKTPAKFYECVGMLYVHGGYFMIPKDRQKAEKYFAKALEAGSKNALDKIINLYSDDKNKMAEVLEKYAPEEALENESAFKAGVLRFNNGKYEEAVKLFERAAETGYAYAYGILFYMYGNGAEIPKDPKKAAKWRKKILEASNYDMTWSAIYLVSPDRAEIKKEKTFKDGFKLAEEVFERGGHGVAPELGDAYIGSNLSDKYAQAESIWLKAEKFGNDLVYSRLANLYGKDGPAEFQNPKKAAYYKNKDIESSKKQNRVDNTQFSEMLGNLIRANDFKGAFEFAKKEDSSALCMMFAAHCLREGLGVEKNTELANKYEKKISDCDSESILSLASELKYGRDGILPVDKEKAREFAELEYVNGGKGHFLAYMLFKGEGGLKDANRAVEILEKNAKNDPYTYYILSGAFMEYEDIRDYKKAFQYAKLAADFHGKSEDFMRIGGMYLNGLGVEKDGIKAFEYFQKALPDTRGINIVALEANAYCYENGIGTPKSPERAKELRKRAESYDADMFLWTIGSAYEWGQSNTRHELPFNLKRAVHWYKIGAEKGNAYSERRLTKILREHPELDEKQMAEKERISVLTKLGTACFYGVGTDANPATAEKYFKEAAELGGAQACMALYEIYNEKDVKKASEYLDRAAELGDGQALYTLGIILSAGNPPIANAWAFDTRIPEEDHKKAFEYFEKAADAGFEPAYERLAEVFSGKSGSEYSPEAKRMMNMKLLEKYYEPSRKFEWAKKWTQKIQSGKSHFNLAIFYYMGIATEKDYEKAFGLFTRANKLGYLPAMIYMAEMYANGQGVEKNPEEARRLEEKFAADAEGWQLVIAAQLYAGLNNGLPKNIEKALRWMKASKAKGMTFFDSRIPLFEKALERQKEPKKHENT